MLVDFADVFEVQHGKACEQQHAITQLHEWTVSSFTNLIKDKIKRERRVFYPLVAGKWQLALQKAISTETTEKKDSLNRSALQVKKN